MTIWHTYEHSEVLNIFQFRYRFRSFHESCIPVSRSGTEKSKVSKLTKLYYWRLIKLLYNELFFIFNISICKLASLQNITWTKFRILVVLYFERNSLVGNIYLLFITISFWMVSFLGDILMFQIQICMHVFDYTCIYIDVI